MRVKENIGKKYGLLTIVSNVWDWRWNYNVKCDCWTEKVVNLYQMKIWKTKSCWCLRKIITSERHKRWEIKYGKPALTHGMTWTKIFWLWANMLSSIRNKKYIKYPYIWWKWISCDERWFNFQWFYDDVKEKYDIAVKEIWESVSLCRIDTDKDYVLENIFFWTKTDWMKQWKRENIIWDWKRYTVYDLKRELWISFYVAKRIIDKWWSRKDFEEYLFTRVKKFEYKWEWLTAREIVTKTILDICPKTLFDRLTKYNMDIDIATTENSFSKSSLAEKEIAKYICSLSNIKIINNKKFFYDWKKSHEIDIYIPEINLWFEYNWSHWHHVSEDKKYKDIKTHNITKHNKKKKFFHEKWINIVYIWDDEWINKKDIVKSMIKNKLWLSHKIYARKCKVVNISQNIFNTFCEKNHIQWKTANTKYRYWLEYSWEIVSVMWFDSKHDLNRFCSILDHNIIWWFQKLLQHHIQEHKPEQITSFAAYDVVNIDDNVYSKHWFIKQWKERISYFYIKDDRTTITRYHKTLFRKEKITKKFWYIFAEWETEYQAMEKLWYLRCYNSWIQKYVLPTWNLAKNHYI